MLKRLIDLAPSEWIANSLTPMPTEPYNPVRVSNCLPSGFPTYCKLFHPIYVDPTVSDLSVSWHKAEGPGHPSVGVQSGGTLVRESSHGREKGDRVRWQQLALRYGLTFYPEINDSSFKRAFPDKSWPRHLLGPDEGTLDRETCGALISALDQLTGEQPCFFYYSGMSVLCGPDHYSPRLYRGSLTDVQAFFEMDEVNASPEYWWPEDREWCICTDWDLSFTLIAGSEAVLDAIANHPLLETLLVTSMSRVDYQADQLNLPHTSPRPNDDRL
jgi:hypothetical protein